MCEKIYDRIASLTERCLEVERKAFESNATTMRNLVSRSNSFSEFETLCDAIFDGEEEDIFGLTKKEIYDAVKG